MLAGMVIFVAGSHAPPKYSSLNFVVHAQRAQLVDLILHGTVTKFAVGARSNTYEYSTYETYL